MSATKIFTLCDPDGFVFTMIDFNTVIDFEHLYNAHLSARKSKRHKNEVIEFETHLSENLWALHYDLLYGKYKTGEYRRFKIYDPKEREVQAIPYRDRIVQHAVCDYYLMPLLEKKLIYDNGACRKNKGTGFCIKRLKHFMTERYKKRGTSGYFVKIDIHKYFDSINHDILKGLLGNIVSDGRMLDLLFLIIDSYQTSAGRGLPLGNQTSQCFALLYLNGVDQFIKHRLHINYYVRYMDDMIMIVDNAASADEAARAVSGLVKELDLEINPKSQKIPIKNGVPFLGWRFFYGKNGAVVSTVLKKSGRRILQHWRAVQKFNPAQTEQTRASYIGYLKNGSANKYVNALIPA